MVYTSLHQKSSHRLDCTLAGLPQGMWTVSMSTNPVQPDTYPGAEPLFDLRAASQQQGLDI